MLNDVLSDIDKQAIFSCICKEPEGDIERFVYPMFLTPENISKFWEKAKQFKVLFQDNINNDFWKFMSVLASQNGDRIISNGLFWMLDDMVGIYYLTHIQEHDAQIHYTFFDRRHRGRTGITKKMIKYVFSEFNFRRLSAEIPACLTGVAAFISNLGEMHSVDNSEKWIGMVQEGRKRSAALMDNEWYDVKCYGILKEEAEQWA